MEEFSNEQNIFPSDFSNDKMNYKNYNKNLNIENYNKERGTIEIDQRSSKCC